MLAGGVAVLKEHSFHRDSSATPVAYLRIIDSHGPYIRIVTSSGNIDILQSNLAGYIETPSSIPQSIQTDADATVLRNWLSSIKAFTARYSRSSTLLDPYEDVISAHLEKFDSGEVRFEGNWIAPEEVVSILDRRKREAEALRREEIDRVIQNEARDADRRASGGVTKNSLTKRRELSDTLLPLISCDLEGAREAIKNLSALAATQSGAPKVRTQRLHDAIRNIFVAEVELSRQIFSNAKALSQAAEYDRRANEWMKPNAFGTIHKGEALESRGRALEIRNDVVQKLSSRRIALVNQLREAEIVVMDFSKLGELRVALALGETIHAIGKRSLPDGTFQSSLTKEVLATIRQEIADRK